MMNAWIFIVPAMGILAVLFGRYTLRIRLVRTGGSSEVVVRFRSVWDVVGLDWQWIGTDSSFHIVLFRKTLGISGKKAESPEPVEEGGEREPDSPRSLRRRRPGVHGLRQMVKVGWKALNRLVRVFHLEQGGATIRFGTGDPCTTGMLYGLMQIPQLIRRKRAEVKVVPDFLNLKLEGEADLTFRFNMLRLVAVMIAVLIEAAVALRRS
jgi:hypothetical protein